MKTPSAKSGSDPEISVARELQPLHHLATTLGVHTQYVDGLARHVSVAPDTLVRVCAALGAPVTHPGDALEAMRAYRASREGDVVPPVLVAWDGHLSSFRADRGVHSAELRLEDGGVVPLRGSDHSLRATEALPWGYHRLTIEAGGRVTSSTVIAAPVRSWRRPGEHRSWGIGAHLAALRWARSRSVGDLRDLESFCRWVRAQGGDLLTLLPLLPTFNTPPNEPSPYSPVSRLFWSELALDLGAHHRATPAPALLDVSAADAEVRAALATHPVPDHSSLDEELVGYARFRGAQRRLGRNWRDWPAAARDGSLTSDLVDHDEERFHLVAQSLVRTQMRDLRQRLEHDGMRLGLDLAVGVHPDGYDPWSRQPLFLDGMSVGAPPDPGFPSGQDWGFSPVLPEASRHEGHRYIASSIAHQAELAGVLRIDHIMAWTRLYWIPHGFGLHEGTYVSYPAEELFAVLSLESHRHRCEIVGENLGTVPREIDEALPRHGIPGMYLAQFEAAKIRHLVPPPAKNTAMIGTHDTPTFAGWIAGNDIEERVHYGLLRAAAAPRERKERDAAVRALAHHLGCEPAEREKFLALLLQWLGDSESPLVIPWLEDLWLEETAVNLPGTPSSIRPNWQRPMGRLLDEMVNDSDVDNLIRCLDGARKDSITRRRGDAETA